MHPKALIFDVFGTLVDWRTSVARHVAPFLRGTDVQPVDFADKWRAQYQPAMDRIRTGGRPYVPLEDLHLENLGHVLEDVGLADRFGPDKRAEFNLAWECLDPWPDVRSGLKLLKEKAIIAPCSNGSIALMTRLARYGGLTWDAILGADLARDYKPRPAVYHACCEALRLDPGDVMMVAAHNDDLHAADACGLQTAFIPRPKEHGPAQPAERDPTGAWTHTALNLPALCAQIFQSGHP